MSVRGEQRRDTGRQCRRIRRAGRVVASDRDPHIDAAALDGVERAAQDCSACAWCAPERMTRALKGEPR
jgi:hypothetical protein